MLTNMVPTILTFVFLVTSMIITPSVEAYSRPQSVEMVRIEQPYVLEDLIASKAKEYKVSESLITKIVNCESSGVDTAVGDNGKSFGLVQIHLPSHPYVSKEEALNPEFAIDFLAKNLAQGKGKLWTCWRILQNK